MKNLKDYEYILSALADKSGMDITFMDLEGQSALSDVFVLVTGNSDVHLKTLVEAAEEALERHGHTCRVEGEGSSNWRLVDAGDLVVHVFSRKGREFYHIERLFENAVIVRYESEQTASAQEGDDRG